MITVRTHLPAGTGPFSRDQIDAVGDHTHTLEAPDLAGLQAEVVNINYLRNADFDLWTRGTTAVSLTHLARTERADHWWARPDYGGVGSGGSGTFCQYAQAADAAHQQWLYCAKLTGAVNTGNLDFGQDIPARVAAALEPKITLTLEVENDTGASITPTVRLDTCNTFESFSSVTNRIAQAVDSSVGNAARKTWTVKLDCSGFLSSLRNGAQIYVRFAGVNDVTKFVKVFACKLEIGETATSRLVERDLVPDAASSATTTPERQYFENPNFAVWLAEQVTCLVGKDAYCAPGFFANAQIGSTMIYRRSDTAPDTQSVFSASLVGDTLVTGTVDFGQNLLRPIAGEARRNVVFSATIWNGTGSALTPNFRVDTCDGLNTFDLVTNRLAQDLAPCADSAWTTVTWTFDASGLTNFEQGARIYLRFATGVMNSVGHELKFSRMRLEPGTTASTFLPGSDVTPPEAIGSIFRRLVVKWTDSTHVAVSFDEIVLTDRGGRNMRLTANSYPSVSTGTNGANGLDYAGAVTASTWHYLWLASTGETSAVFISKSATEPALATGYLWRARIGAFYVNGSSQIPELAIVDDKIFLRGAFPLGDSPGTTVTTAATFQALVLTNFIPPEARRVWGVAGIRTTDECPMAISASDGATDMKAGIGTVLIQGVNRAGAVFSGMRFSAPFEVPIITPQTIYWAAGVKGTTEYRMVISGFSL